MILNGSIEKYFEADMKNFLLQILNKNYASVNNLQQRQQQNRASDPFPIIVRQMQTSGKQKAAGSQPPSNYSKQTLWIAAILLGGGAYIIYEYLKGKSIYPNKAESVYTKKRKFNFNN